MVKHLINYIILLAAVLLTAACTDKEAINGEEPLPEGMGRIRLTICTPEITGANSQSSTRAVNVQPWEDPDHEWERLQTFRIFICKASNNEVVQIIEGDKNNMTAVLGDSHPYKQSAEIVSDPLDAGTYHIFATANYDDGYSVGSIIDLDQIVKFNNGYSATSPDYFGEKKDIPMTGKMTNADGITLKPVGVANGTEVNAGTITVWRVMGKMQFYFTNQSVEKIKIKGIEVEPLNLASSNGPGIYLFSKDVLTSTNNLAAKWVTEPVNVTDATATWALHDAAMQSKASVSPAGLFAQAQLMWGPKLESTGQINVSGASTKLQKFKALIKVTGQDEGAAIILQVKPMNGLTFTPTHLSFKACKAGTDSGEFDVVVISNGTSTNVASNQVAARNSVSPYITTFNYNLSSLLSNAATTGTFYVKIYLKNLNDNKEYAFSDIVITGNVRNAEGVTTESVTLPGGARDDVGTFTYTPASPLELNATNGEGTVFFYVNESDGTYTATENQLSLRFKIQRQNPTTQEWYDDEIRYGVTTHHDLTNSGTYGGYNGGFNVIRRNDWIHIPVVLTDWQLRIEPLAFVPIAGYPATTVSSDGLTTTFSTGGIIALQPFVKKYNDPTWRDFSDPEVTFVSLSWKNSDGTNVSGDNKIVKTPFAYDNANHCVIGELNNNLSSGPHKTTLTVNVKLGPTGSQFEYSFTCNVILQK